MELIKKITSLNKQERFEKIISLIDRPYIIQEKIVKDENPFAEMFKKYKLDMDSDELQGFDFSIFDSKKEYHVRNIIIPAKSGTSKMTFMAHWDLYPGSLGYNDNSSSVSSLLKIQNYVHDDMTIVFTDFEESFGIGSQLYCDNLENQWEIIINLDVCGFGENIFIDMNGWSFDEIDIPTNFISYEGVPFNDSHITSDNGFQSLLLVTGNSSKTLIGDIFDLQHGGKFDNDLTKLNQPILDKVETFLKGIIDSN